MIFTAVSHRPRQNDTLGNTDTPIDFAIEEFCGVRLLQERIAAQQKLLIFVLAQPCATESTSCCIAQRAPARVNHFTRRGKISSKMRPRGTAAMRDQHQQQIGSQRHGAAGDPQRRRSWFGRLLVQLDQPFRFAGKLTVAGLIFGLFGSLVGAYAHYATWRDEQKLATYKEDLAHAIATFSETSTTLSAVMNLQQILFFTFTAALDAGKEDEENSFYAKNAKQSYDDYFTSRTALRKDIDSLAGKAEVFLDLPIDQLRDPVSAGALLMDPVRSHPYFSASERNSLKHNGFDCDKHLPTPEAIKVGEIVVDWQRAKHHVITFYFCLEKNSL
jgi:hypothetical protein